jgi:Asp-tRNA(Asn)/Glu-tRNA(Gln) amidotransferase A subunit family amidase
MTEFAFSGVGINPHYGTPVNPCDTQIERIPGGSSSGAAVSVATGAAVAGLGSDTGGSLRIPAALCGLVGFKSTARLVPTEGAVPLSTTLDTVGAITRSVRDAITLHEVLAQRQVVPTGLSLKGARLAVADTWMLDDMAPEVTTAFEASLRILRQAGAQIENITLSEIAELAQINAGGGFSAAESHAWHRRLLNEQAHRYDPRVAKRILRGAQMSAADYLDLIEARRSWVARMEQRLSDYDAVISPTVPMLAPPTAPLAYDDDAFFKVNALLLRNPSVVNMLDGCAISLPCHELGSLPVGLMLWQGAMHDDRLLSLALQVEAALIAAGRG